MRKYLAILGALALCCAIATASAAGGSAADPVVTLSYINETYLPAILTQSQEVVDEKFAELHKEIAQRLSALCGDGAIYAAMLRAGGYTVEHWDGGAYTLPAETVAAGGLGVMFTLTGGTAAAVIPAGGALIDLYDAADCYAGQVLAAGHTYLVGEETFAGLRALEYGADITTGSGFLSAGLAHPVRAAFDGVYYAAYTRYADALHEMGLFLGTGDGYDLARSATRTEALVMLIRLLGEEDEALAYTGRHPFRDVAPWADHYVAYAYHMGYTNGVSATVFGAQEPVTEAQYFTFLLRALGYDDNHGDFYWESAAGYAVDIGMLSAAEEVRLRTPFYRDQMVFASYQALYTDMKDSLTTLAEKLIAAGAIAWAVTV